MARITAACPCGHCDPHKVSFRQCPATDMELAQIAKARKLTGAKLAAMMPAWLKTELAKSKMPARFKFIPDKAPVYPTISRACVATKNPGPNPFGSPPGKRPYLCANMSMAQYVKAYEKLVGLRA